MYCNGQKGSDMLTCKTMSVLSVGKNARSKENQDTVFNK